MLFLFLLESQNLETIDKMLDIHRSYEGLRNSDLIDIEQIEYITVKKARLANICDIGSVYAKETFSFDIYKGDKILIYSDKSNGKTLLLKQFAGEIEALKDTIIINGNIDINDIDKQNILFLSLDFDYFNTEKSMIENIYILSGLEKNTENDIKVENLVNLLNIYSKNESFTKLQRAQMLLAIGILTEKQLLLIDHTIIDMFDDRVLDYLNQMDNTIIITSNKNHNNWKAFKLENNTLI